MHGIEHRDEIELAQTPTESALRRLDAARERLHAIIALALGVRSLTTDEPRKPAPSFRPKPEETRQRLRGIEHEQAQRLLDADATLNSRLLPRHEVTHGLAAIIRLPSMTCVEVGNVREEVVCRNEAKALIPNGLEQLPDYEAATLLHHALRSVETGLHSLRIAAAALADLLDAVGELEPPPLIWQAEEVSQLFATRREAKTASRAAAAGGDQVTGRQRSRGLDLGGTVPPAGTTSTTEASAQIVGCRQNPRFRN